MSQTALPKTTAEALLGACALLNRHCGQPWHVFGSSALSLHGIQGIDVRDIDILISHTDAQGLLSSSGLTNEAGQGMSLFRSDIFMRLPGYGCDVEIMAGMTVCAEAGWKAFVFHTQEVVRFDGQAICVPTLNELKQSLRLFGRAKDLARLKLIEDQS